MKYISLFYLFHQVQPRTRPQVICCSTRLHISIRNTMSVRSHTNISSSSSSLTNTSTPLIQLCVEDIQKSLQLLANTNIKIQQENYFKQQLPFRGIKVPNVEICINNWIKDTLITDKDILQDKSRKNTIDTTLLSTLSKPIYLTPEQRFELMLQLLQQNYSEDKSAGIYLGSKTLLKSSLFMDPLQYKYILSLFQSLFINQYIQDWGTCDSFCGKILSTWIKFTLQKPLVKIENNYHMMDKHKNKTKIPTLNNLTTITSTTTTTTTTTNESSNLATTLPLGIAITKLLLSEWSIASNLWQSRASIIPFVTLARHGDKHMYPGFLDNLENSCTILLCRKERFLQTGAGWIIREISKGDKERIQNYIEKNLTNFTPEGLRYSLEAMKNEEREVLRQQYKLLQADNKNNNNRAIQEIDTSIINEKPKRPKVVRK